MQKRVNDRTALYGKWYATEQVPKVTIEREKGKFARLEVEMKELAARQERIAKTTRDLGKESEDGVRPID